eukprot:Nitzschia sp. Nitz4//scaffold33_size148984//108967//111638//NITZ4_002941-RA/size148984-augustus-gene-0.258-mRNA-1//1//CDS//3329548466//3811//frame0
MSLLDDVFTILETATKLEKSGQNRIEASTKYYEAVYLMRQLLSRTPQEDANTRNLLESKVQFYTEKASTLYFDDSSMHPSAFPTDPRSPLSHISAPSFFQDNMENAQENNNPKQSSSVTELNRQAGQANNKLANAVDLDETGNSQKALPVYMKAAELYLGAIKLCETIPAGQSKSVAPLLARRLEGVMDRIEQIKHPKRHVVRQDKSGDDLRSVAGSLSAAEVDVLKRSSLIASGLFLPWSDEEALQLSHQVQQGNGRSNKLYTDPKGDLQLSEKQLRKFQKWARPNEIVQMRKRMGSRQAPPVMIRSLHPGTIRQRYVTDCSFIASLCICASFENRFRKRLITSIIYPQDRNGIPIYNPEGKYMVKLWLNGVARQVVVDDRLPIDEHSNLLCSSSSSSKEQLELWVSIIEKAYMKLCGGYDFPGSNSGVDLFSLTGWIPERIFFPKNPEKVRDFETPPERAWDRLFSANSFGDCLITVSMTREISEETAEKLGLVTGHAYAVLEVVQTSAGVRMLQLKNPWASTSWKGKYSSQDKVSWRNQTLREELGYDPVAALQRDDGVFWICWDDVLLYFQEIQLSWNPALFSYSTQTHKFWPGDQGPVNDTFNVGENPQYVVTLSDEAISKQAPFWVLISRHVTKQEQEGTSVDDFLTVHMLRNNEKKEKIWYPHGRNSLVNGAYTNNPHVLVRYEISGPKDKYISLVLSQHQKSQDLGYTLSCFCTERFSLGAPQKDLSYEIVLQGSWTEENAAGPIGKKLYFQNPMYMVQLSDNETIQLRCSTVKSLAVNIILICVPDKASAESLPVNTKRYGTPVLDSGNYRHGFTVTERTKVARGTYSMIVSTFHEGNLGNYSISLASASKGTVKVERVQ